MNGRNSFTEFYKNLHLHGIYKNFFGYDKAQIKREAKKNDSTDSNDKKQQQHSAEQQKPDPETTRETEKNSGIIVSVDPAGDAAFHGFFTFVLLIYPQVISIIE